MYVLRKKMRKLGVFPPPRKCVECPKNGRAVSHNTSILDNITYVWGISDDDRRGRRGRLKILLSWSYTLVLFKYTVYWNKHFLKNNGLYFGYYI